LTVAEIFAAWIIARIPARIASGSVGQDAITADKSTSWGRAGRAFLRLTESYFGREDTNLTAKLLVELPGILNWAIEGWHRLRKRGHFHMPQRVEDAVQELENLASPVRAFVQEACIVGAACRVSLDALYAEWRTWCTQEGRNLAGTRQSFGRNLAAAVTGVVRRRGTGQQPFYEGIGLKAASTW
jgi:DNA methylase